jgi:hypothetical protein
MLNMKVANPERTPSARMFVRSIMLSLPGQNPDYDEAHAYANHWQTISAEDSPEMWKGDHFR